MKYFLSAVLLFFICSTVYAQTGIGTTTPNASAKLEVASTDKGLLVPRMTKSQKDAIASPANGLFIYQTDSLAGFYVNRASNGSKDWIRVSSDWTKNGTTISTTDNVSLSGNFAGGNASTSTLSGFAANMNSQTGTSYTLVTADNGRIITLNNANSITLNIPSLFIGFNCMVIQLGDGQITFTQSGTTVVNRSSFTKTGGKNAIVTIVGIAANSYILSGDMSN